ncbi:MAG: hypothetical protein ACRD18_16920, partial [Terriglobia bacterium]
MRFNGIQVRAALAAMLLFFIPALLAGAPTSGAHGQKAGPEQILAHMDDAARRVKTISAQLTYTTVTVLVNDHST